MKQFHCYYTAGLFALCSTVIVLWGSCAEKNCLGTDFTYSPDWTSEHLNNSGASPEPSLDDIPLVAYGIRIINTPVIAPYKDTRCDFFYLTNTVKQLQIFSLLPFDSLPAGAEVTDRFRARVIAYQTVYLSVPEILDAMNYPVDGKFNPYYADFILVNGPAGPDSCQFNIRLLFADSTIVNIPTNPVFLK